MTDRNAETSLRTAAIVAGVGYLISFLFTIPASIFVDGLFVPGDAATTANNIMASGMRLSIGIVSWLIVILGDLVRAWALYVFLKQVNKSLAMLAAWFMLIHDAIFATSLINLILGRVLLTGADFLPVFGADQLHSLVLLFFNGYNYGFILGLFFFGFHLGILGYLVYKSGFIPRILGVLLYLAALGFLVNSVGKILSPNFPEIIWTVFTLPMFIGELSIMVWLVFKGGKGTVVE